MTAVSEAIPYRPLEMPKIPGRLAQTRDRLLAAYDRVRPREIIPHIPTEGIIFPAVVTPEQRAESEARFMTTLSQKKKLRDAGDPTYKDIPLALVVGGGGMKGAASGAMLEVLRDNKLLDLFSDIYTDSAGTANMACVLGSDSMGADTYIKLAKERFSGRLPHKMKLPMLLQLIIDNVDPERILEGEQNWYIGVTDSFGKKKHKLAKDISHREFYRNVAKSMAAPWAWNRLLKNTDPLENRDPNEDMETDGYLTGLSIHAAINHGHKDIMVLMNETDGELMEDAMQIPFSERLALPVAMMGIYSREVIQATLHRRKNLKDSLMLLDQRPDVNVSKLTSAHYIDWLTSNVGEIEKTIAKTRSKTEQLFDQHGLLEKIPPTVPALV